MYILHIKIGKISKFTEQKRSNRYAMLIKHAQLLTDFFYCSSSNGGSIIMKEEEQVERRRIRDKRLLYGFGTRNLV